MRVGDRIINEECKIFEIVDKLPDGIFRCSRVSDFSTHATEFIRVQEKEFNPEPQGGFYTLTMEALQLRLNRYNLSTAVALLMNKGNAA